MENLESHGENQTRLLETLVEEVKDLKGSLTGGHAGDEATRKRVDSAALVPGADSTLKGHAKGSSRLIAADETPSRLEAKVDQLVELLATMSPPVVSAQNVRLKR